MLPDRVDPHIRAASVGATWTRRLPAALLPPLLAVGAAVSLAPADAAAATYVARPADGGRIELEVDRGRLRRAEATLPSRCENNHGGNWDARLRIDLTGAVALRSGRFDIQGQAPDEVRYKFDGRLRDGAISGRMRLTYLDLDFIGVDDSYLCDTGSVRYRGVKRR
jgi:hypothetical protein